MTPGRDLTLQAIRHPRGWLLLRLAVPFIPGTPWKLDLMLNTGRTQSAISPRTRDTLLIFGALRHRAGQPYILSGARAGDQPLPDITLRLSAGPALLGLEGMLGLDFLDHFAEVRLDTRSLRICPRGGATMMRAAPSFRWQRPNTSIAVCFAARQHTKNHDRL